VVLDWPRYFLTTGSADRDRLRGRPVFEMWREHGYNVEIGASIDIRLPAVILMPPPNEIGACVVERLRQRTDCVVVIDICFPLMRPDAMLGDAEAMAFWTRHEHQDAALRGVRAADAVTVPWPEWDGYPGWIDDLAEHNPNVIVLPDLGDPDPDGVHLDLNRFAWNLLAIWTGAAETKQARLAMQPHRP
jgi:hypothetical protein